MKRVVWTPTARMSLQQTIDFIIELWNEKIADEFLNQLDYRIIQIQRNPELAPAFKDSKIRQLLIHRTVSVFYIVNPKYIKLLLVWDNRLSPERLFEQLTKANGA